MFADPIRLIGSENQQIGVVSLVEAADMAKNEKLDLVEISPTSEPPVCRIMDYGKYLYEQKRKVKQNVKKQHVILVKEIRLRPKTDPHDLQTKLGHAKKFFEKGNRVQFTMMFRGREMLHLDRAQEMMQSVVDELEAVAKVDRPPSRQGRRITMTLFPK
ncbi:MAG: translation initiation factor IF-3 [Anaerohalosphaeraceae bacterium]|nr:translation initiation factor IF-3 [Anaerohalosphaeraceae bacterium]